MAVALSISNKKKKLALTVTNDLVADNRVHKVATTLTKLGFDVTLIGRKLPESPILKPREYKTHRMNLIFNRGPLFYAAYNISLFFHLLIKQYDLVVSNDLDSLPAGFVFTKLANKKLVYDSHEYYTEVPELVNRPNIKRIWEWLEATMIPEIKYCYTVCQSIADVYNSKYGANFEVVRNVPFKSGDKKNELLNEIDLPTDQPIILYQGAINLGRGIEDAIQAMKKIENARLVIVGNGDLFEDCQQLAIKEGVSEKVIFTGRIPYDEVKFITQQATIGLSVEKDMGLNYRFALPNKIFDYIQSGIPILASSLPEIKRVIDDYNVGMCIPVTNADELVIGINQMLSNERTLTKWKDNCKLAAKELCWENEEKILINLFDQVVKA